jgi:hypothetical protein
MRSFCLHDSTVLIAAKKDGQIVSMPTLFSNSITHLLGFAFPFVDARLARSLVR